MIHDCSVVQELGGGEREREREREKERGRESLCPWSTDL